MGIFNKWILAKAERIKAKNEAIARSEREQLHKEYVIRRDLINSVKSKLTAFIQTKIKEYDETFPCELKVGDRAIINYYSFRRSGDNGWDGGPGALLNNIPKEELTKPIVVKITKIYVDASLADERIDSFINDSILWMLRSSLENQTLEKIYSTWCSKYRASIIEDIFGLYRTAHFEYDGSFKPTWGLNTNSFISDRYPEFQETFDLWQTEIDLTAELAKINSAKAEVKSRIAILQAKKQLIYESRN